MARAKTDSSGAFAVCARVSVSRGAKVARLRATANGATKVTASLNAAQEVPTPSGASARAGGTFTGTISEGSNPRLTWRLSFRGLTGPALQAHVHTGRPGVAGPVVVPLCGDVVVVAAGVVPAPAGPAVVERRLAHE